MALPKDLLDILACPETKASLVEEGDTLVSTDAKTRRRYKVEDGIPNMLIEDSEQVPEAEWREIMKRHGVEVKG